MMEWSPGDRILLNDRPAEVIKTESIGDIEYLRAYIDDIGAKTVCVADVTIEPVQSQLETIDTTITTELHPDHDAVSARWLDLRSQAVELEIAHEQGQLLSISNSLVRLEPYQLACVNWVMEKLRQRALIADDVGLGKTIEAGLILKELAARNRADRVLFVVPAHLQMKWIRDMDRFFDIDLTLADRSWVDGERRRLGEETNIWSQEHQQLITSMAFLRQDEFQPEISDAFWDVVVIDESHKAAKRGESPSKTARMAETVSTNSDSLLLLSATPHDGKGDAFRSLVEYIDPFLVAEEQDLSKEAVDRVMIRRGKQSIYDDSGNRVFPDRDVGTIAVEMTPAETKFYEAVTKYVQNVYNRSEKLNEPAVGFAMALMQKRLVSSIGAIKATLSRRLATIVNEQSTATELSAEANAYLDGEDLTEEDKEQVEAELAQLTVTESDAQLEGEIETLRDLIGLADRITVDSKARQVRRYIQQLLETHPDEKVLLFTEYRDTLDYLLELVTDEPWADEILLIHGDVDKQDRAAIESEFNYGESRLLFATDAASEGIDLQHSCHIMINYELPWNPNRLEQRIGRIHRYGQENTVKVWNFTFEDTREGQIFELLQEKVETIRGKLGNTADVLGILDEINVDTLIMDSIQNNEPTSVTTEELEQLIDERQKTLAEWYDRSLIDTTTFDEESRRKIQGVIDSSEDVYGGEAEVKTFVEDTIEALGGTVESAGHNLYRATLPQSLHNYSFTDPYGPFTFDRSFAMDHEGIDYLTPETDLVQALITQLLNSEDGTVGMKLLPFLETPGIMYNYRIGFEDATGDLIREETIPVFVDITQHDPSKRLGEQIRNGKTVYGTPIVEHVQSLLRDRDKLREVADRYVSHHVAARRVELSDRRQKETQQELDDLNAYATAERDRIEAFIKKYQARADAGEDMALSIRKQRTRLEEIENRIEKRRGEVNRKAQIISLAPTVENVCLSLPV